MAEVVKTGLLMGQPVWELPLAELVRRCAAFKAGVCIADPHDRGPRNQLNLGHTFGHALEAAAGYDLPHGQAVALGMVAALRLSGNDAALAAVREQLDPQPVRVDREAAWAALARDKKTRRRGAAARAARADRRADVGQRGAGRRCQGGARQPDRRTRGSPTRSESQRAHRRPQRGQPQPARPARPGDLRRPVDPGPGDADLRLGARARPAGALPPDEPRGRVRRASSTRRSAPPTA